MATKLGHLHNIWFNFPTFVAFVSFVDRAFKPFRSLFQKYPQ